MQGLTFLQDAGVQTEQLPGEPSAPSFYGLTASGGKAYRYYQPSVEAFAAELSEAARKELNPNLRIPIPPSRSFHMAGNAGDKQLTLMLDRDTAKPFRAVFGYVAFMSEKEDQVGTAPPLCAQIVLKLPFRYGTAPWETEDSFIFCRLNAFASKACLPVASQPIGLGSVVHGAIEKPHTEHDTAQLTPGGAHQL